jgi:hypothetical protein
MKNAVFWNVINQFIPHRFEVFTAVTMKNGVFWDVTPCGSCNNRRFGELDVSSFFAPCVGC